MSTVTTTVGQAMRRTRLKSSRMSGFTSVSSGGAPDKFLAETNVGQRRITGRSVKSGYVPSRMSAMQVDPRSITQWYQYGQDFKDNAAMFRYAMDRIVGLYAVIAAAGAQKRSLGPVDPMMTNMAAAWRVPVRRITGAYFLGWKVEHLSLGVWALTNESREAFYIEFGINHGGTGLSSSSGAGARVRVRRPIMKLAVLEAIKIVHATNADASELVAAVMPSGLYQSPMITGAIRPKGPTGSALGLVNLNALKSMVGT